jgi:ribosomal protein S2
MATAADSFRQLSQKEADIQLMLAADVHLGTKNCDFQMERYIFKRRNDGNIQISITFLKFYFFVILHLIVENRY